MPYLYIWMGLVFGALLTRHTLVMENVIGIIRLMPTWTFVSVSIISLCWVCRQEYIQALEEMVERVTKRYR